MVTKELMAPTAQLLEDSLLVIWNDRNADRRLDAMQKIYASDIHFYESNTGEAIVGHQEINDLISKLQAAWPIEFQFQLSKPAQVNHTTQVAFWKLGPEGMQSVATGMDVAIIENEVIKSLYLFLDVEESVTKETD
ncbi:hypothetical protein [Hymenobacter lucidus]|uniref:Nuclear transport factor 2 family protein n=1 Tax=Hymenobacter lucidus TaxID=2880930 RepID=A0ABS8AWH1_9BACT|nr:hypothetical protein [Hymenobacter lucidus]MCB2410149.1 hypothetical protein [Hymenobacter lucidus]